MKYLHNAADVSSDKVISCLELFHHCGRVLELDCMAVNIVNPSVERGSEKTTGSEIGSLSAESTPNSAIEFSFFQRVPISMESAYSHSRIVQDLRICRISDFCIVHVFIQMVL